VVAVVRRKSLIIRPRIASAGYALVLLCPLVLLADEPQRLIRRLDDPMRAKVLAALAGLIILGFAMVAFAWLGARVVQRYRHGTSFFRPTPRPGEHEWAKKPLTPPEPNSPARRNPGP
jgi:hypothetical protein